MRLGIDFDNTIARYDTVFREVAVEWGLVGEGFDGGKQAVREAIRARPGGESEWQRLQGRVYGKYMGRAELMDGLGAFLFHCRERGVEVCVVSHKTEFGHFDPERIDLRAAARRWMEDRGFFSPDGFALSPDRVFFEPTREGKVARIRELACALFIDDLIEVFREPGFPAEVRRWLYVPSDETIMEPGVEVFRHWDEMADELFGK